MSHFGRDLSCVDDLDVLMREVDDIRTLREAIARRLMTRRRSLIDDPDYGEDLREWLGRELDAVGLLELTARVRAECLKDERVIDARPSLERVDGSGAAKHVIMRIDGDAAFGPFSLTLDVTAAKVALVGTNV